MARILVLAPEEALAGESAVNRVCTQAMVRALREAPGIASCRKVKPQDLCVKALERADVLLIGGGEPLRMRELLKHAAVDIRAWLQSGNRGLIGICAGAVVASSHPRRGLGLVSGVQLCDDNLCASAGLVDDVPLEPVHVDADWLFKGTSPQLHYENGPILKAVGSEAKSLANYGSVCADDDLVSKADAARGTRCGWCCFECETWNRTSQKRCGACGEKKREQLKELKQRRLLAARMQGRSAIVSVDTGQSRAVLFGPHPELSSGCRRTLLRRAALWACGQASEDVEESSSVARCGDDSEELQ